MSPTLATQVPTETRRSRSSRPTPTTREMPFAIEELFYSITDEQGRIRSGNEVFVRTSGYGRSDLVGSPHNLIRHPDMPRAAFQLMWEHLAAGEPFAAYVKNLSADGSYYWVVAFVVPEPGGFLSVRLKPTTELFAPVQVIYADMLALEAEHEDGSRLGRDAGMQAARELLDVRVQAAGHASYPDFMRAMLVAEVASRETRIGGPSRRLDVRAGDDARSIVAQGCAALDEVLRGLVGSADALRELRVRLKASSRAMLGLSARVRVTAINAMLAASRLGPRGLALGSVATLMRERSDEIEAVVRHLEGGFTAAVGQLEDVTFRAAAGRLQIEMALTFTTEQATVTATDHDLDPGLDAEDAVVEAAARDVDVAVLVRCLGDEVERLVAGHAALARRAADLVGEVARLTRAVARLSTLELNGRVESARLDAAGRAASDLFSAVAAEIGSVREQVAELADVCARLSSYDPATAARALELVTDIRRAAAG